jgi:hypothetical protein
MRLLPLCIVVLLCFTVPVTLQAVNTSPVEKAEQQDLPLDGLSVAAFASVMLGIASLFIVPALSILLFPAGLVMGAFAAFGKNKNRYEKRRGRGLALAAIIVGGAYVGLLAVAFLLTAIFGVF